MVKRNKKHTLVLKKALMNKAAHKPGSECQEWTQTLKSRGKPHERASRLKSEGVFHSYIFLKQNETKQKLKKDVLLLHIQQQDLKCWRGNNFKPRAKQSLGSLMTAREESGLRFGTILSFQFNNHLPSAYQVKTVLSPQGTQKGIRPKPQSARS